MITERKPEQKTLLFRKATEKDLFSATAILKAAVDRMIAEGKHQWDHNYPNDTHVRTDLNKGLGYVLELDKEIVVYGAVIFDGEPAYNCIRGSWLSNGSYVVVHRMAVLPESQNKGYALSFLNAVEKLALSKDINNFRIDTNYDNDRMLNLLKKAGFTYCGEIRYESGTRMAFEKMLQVM